MLDLSRIIDTLSVLKTALSRGYSVQSSPVDLLLESILDLALILKREFFEGSFARKLNPSLRFSKRYQDPLGNPKQIKFQKSSKFYQDDQAADFFEGLALVIKLIKEQKPVKAAFMAGFRDLFLSLDIKIKRLEQISNEEEKLRRQKSKFFYRRQIRRKY